jgi:hypothetical protein
VEIEMTEMPQTIFPGASELVDLTAIPLRELVQEEHSALARSLSRIIDGVLEKPLAAFSNRAG